ncbi:hypothetical protein L917_20682 [Phytophthora nicotianae]|uniref:Alcohol dehydrogenase-like C-terminal domain-containing protein n=1 Tax=Phytophthora nicotianae TaxID=4792 RepID=W2M8D2_PHYNI|nr:hypothetical protein L915_20950 [Phytophthora nicotianae]ETL78526.1 hypothetical protein L917_20682 [Phytophthora nicotianae]ETM31793.1 hypothetical protein L914_20699 [Phytophthora nicotianae]
MPYTLFLSFLAVHGTVIMVGLPNDEIKFSPYPLVGKGLNFKGSAIGSIQDIKDMLELASKKNVRPVIQKLPMSKVNEGIQMVRNGTNVTRISSAGISLVHDDEQESQPVGLDLGNTPS